MPEGEGSRPARLHELPHAGLVANDYDSPEVRPEVQPLPLERIERVLQRIWARPSVSNCEHAGQPGSCRVPAENHAMSASRTMKMRLRVVENAIAFPRRSAREACSRGISDECFTSELSCFLPTTSQADHLLE